MGDRTSVQFLVGGGIPRSLLNAFLEAAAAAEGLGLDYGFSAVSLEALEAASARGWLELSAGEVNYANCDTFEDFCQENNLVYRKEWDAGGGYGPGGELWDVAAKMAGEPIGYCIGGIGQDVGLTDREIRECGSWDALMARLDRLTASLPPFKIVEG